jgi:hypothetical protein
MATTTAGPHRLAVREDPASLTPAVDRLVPGTTTTAMVAVASIEIVAGLVVAVRKVGGYLVAPGVPRLHRDQPVKAGTALLLSSDEVMS